MPRGRCPDTGFAKPNDLSVLNAPCCWLIFSCMFDPDAAFYTLSYATVTGVVLVVLVLGSHLGKQVITEPWWRKRAERGDR